MIDFWAWAQTFGANVAIGLHRRWGWLMLATGCLTWAWIGWRGRLGNRRIWWLMIGSLLSAGLALVNWWRW